MKNQNLQNTNIRKKFLVFRIMIAGSMLVFLAVILLLSQYSMEDIVSAKAIVMPEKIYKLKTTADSTITQICKEDGDYVDEGETIIKLDASIQREKIAELQISIRDLQAELKVKEKNYEIICKDPLPEEYRHAEIIFRETKKNLEKREDALKRYKILYQKKIVSKAALEKVEIAYYKTKGFFERAKEIYDKVKGGLGNRIIKKAEEEIEMLKTKIEGEKEKLKYLKKHIDYYIIKSPARGIVTDIYCNHGDFVRKGDILARVATVKNKKIIAFVTQNCIYKVKSGQKVRIASQVYNKLKYGYFYGKVKKICELPMEEEKNPLYEVEITFTKQPYDIKSGSNAYVEIITGHEKIFSVLSGLNQ